MSNHPLFKYASVAGISMLVAGGAQYVLAQTSDEVATTEDGLNSEVMEEVIIEGFRGSLISGLDAKRASGNITDAIFAEDIGKSTDQNIAEALQRVTGISINREDGEGSTIVVRGAPADLNNITLNGVAVTSGELNQGVNLNTFSADVLRSIEVFKTASADHDEGSLGATVELKTFKPLAARKNRRTVEVQGRYNSFTEQDEFDDYKFNLAWSEKLLDDRLGLGLVLTSETQTTRRDLWSNNRVPTANGGFGATNIETGEVITEFDFGNGLVPLRGLVHNNIFYDTDTLETDRFNASGTIQFRPTDATDIQLDVTYSTRDDDRFRNRFQVNPDRNNRAAAQGNPEDLLFDPNSFFFVRSLQTAVDGPNNQNRESDLAITQTEIQTEAETVIISGELIHVVDDFTFTLKGGHSETTSETPFNYFARFNTARPRRTERTIGYECVNNSPELCFISAPEDYISDPTNFQFQNSSITEQDISDQASSVFFDVDWEKEAGPFSSFEAGLKWSTRNKDTLTRFVRLNNTDTMGQLRGGLTLADFTDGTLTQPFGEELGLPRTVGTNGFITVDSQAVFNAVAEIIGGVPEGQIRVRDTRDVTVDVFSGYLMGNIDLLDGRLTGDIGVRFTQTDIESAGFSGFNYNGAELNATPENIDFFGSEQAAIDALGINTLPRAGDAITLNDPPDIATSGENDYFDVLPSINLNYAASEDVILRFAASKTIARPRIDDLKPGFAITEQVFQANSTGNIGNPLLSPFESTNIDFSAEWYFNEGSLLSAAFFNKDLKNIAETTSVSAFWRDFRDEFYGADGVLLPEDQIDFTTSAADVLLPISGGADQAGCFPNREFDLANPNGPVGCDVVILNQPRNATSGFVRGVELSFQHNFDHLPGPLSGLGVVLNYTYADSGQDAEPEEGLRESPLVETSEHTANATVFYENERLLLRVAFNTRSDYLVNRSTAQDNSLWIEGFDTVDVSASYKINDWLSINFQGQNVTDTVRRSYITTGNEASGTIPAEPIEFGGNDSRTARLQNTGPIYRLGIRANF